MIKRAEGFYIEWLDPVSKGLGAFLEVLVHPSNERVGRGAGVFPEKSVGKKVTAAERARQPLLVVCPIVQLHRLFRYTRRKN